MVAIVVSLSSSGPRPSRPRWQSTDRRRSDRTPPGPQQGGGRPRRDFLVSRGMGAAQGKKVATGRCGLEERGGAPATAAFDQTCPIGDDVGGPPEPGPGTTAARSPAHPRQRHPRHRHPQAHTRAIPQPRTSRSTGPPPSLFRKRKSHLREGRQPNFSSVSEPPGRNPCPRP